MINENLLHFTDHALKQMSKRQISKEHVLLALNHPDSFQKGSHSNETIAVKKLGKKRIRVIYVSEPEKIKIITVTH